MRPEVRTTVAECMVRSGFLGQLKGDDSIAIRFLEGQKRQKRQKRQKSENDPLGQGDGRRRRCPLGVQC